jgi:hypothetical protein
MSERKPALAGDRVRTNDNCRSFAETREPGVISVARSCGLWSGCTDSRGSAYPGLCLHSPKESGIRCPVSGDQVSLDELKAPRHLVGYISNRIDRASTTHKPQYPDGLAIFEVIVSTCHLTAAISRVE